MRILKKKTLQDFWQLPGRQDSQQALTDWFNRITDENQDFKSFNQLKSTFASSDYIGNNRVVFNIKGNAYRLIVEFHLPTQRGYIVFIGTHAEYNLIDAITIDMEYP
ncbi:MAG: type II toxin-antitoxin system HigB family toxin [Bacteroidia bacterium]|nr:type II toxin-antitoxin system HigB family toxin [Bacteroidia bacterium]